MKPSNVRKGTTLKVTGRRKILFLESEDRFFWSHSLPMARAALQLGHEVVVATHVDGYGQQIQDEGFRLIPIHLHRKIASPLAECRVIRQLRQIYRHEKPDLVHHFALKSVLYGSVARLGKRDLPAINALTGLGYLVASSSWKARALRRPVWQALRFFLNRPGQRVVVENEDDYRVVISQLEVVPRNISIIPACGVDIDHYQPSPEPEGASVVLLASRMLRIKGVEEFVEAANVLRSKGIYSRFVLAGCCDPSNPSHIPRERLLQWDHSGVVEWLDHQSDMRGLLRRSSIVCLPSHGGEGMPKVLMEAAASARAIVTTNVPGCREIVRDAVNGLVVSPGDVVGLASALERLIMNRRLRAEMAAMGRRIATEEFSQQAAVHKIMGLYGELGVNQAGGNDAGDRAELLAHSNSG